MNKSIHQWLPGFAPGDAISNDALVIQKYLKQWGYDSEIFCPLRHTGPKVRELCKDWGEYVKYSNAGNKVIYHFSIGSPLSEKFRNIPDRKLLIYHNITPDIFFRHINAEKAFVLYKGREELRTLKDVPELALADSEYNRMELDEWGYKKTAVLPPFIGYEGLRTKPSRKILNEYDSDWVNLLFVGRVTPNKKIEDVISVFYYYKNTINPKSRLFIVGSHIGMEKYYMYLKAMAVELNMADDVHFSGHVPAEDLAAYYSMASVFVCMSEHEGFCIPLVESMYFEVPIIAYSAAAIPFTLGNSGISVTEKKYEAIAELIESVVSDKATRYNIIENQNKRLTDFSEERVAEELKKYL